MDLQKIEKQWEEYNEEFDSSDYMDVDTHTSMAMAAGDLIQEVKRLTKIIEDNDLPLNPCQNCGKEEANPGLSVCGPCYHKQIWGDND